MMVQHRRLMGWLLAIGPFSAFGKDAMGCNLAALGPGDNVGVARSP